ncbi:MULTISPECIES: toll/interleukin-1 receptor domain-containing protein [unclassified Streptomyces]|uniref:toll/interleukin-1 receptor domain-containing protein n=1 Tax=unclassified Streptomyces TaxID=2593676 RepID=UPI002E315C60|nr:toll/interleukin-1 receptor domain-containing protein [Streptomyces sp. NBC_01268]
MHIFISWSGEASRQGAEALREWLPYMNPEIEPFVSSQDISKGERGLTKIADRLQESSFGIVCVTRDNQSAPWINFEAGALSRELGESSLAPLLLDMQVKDLAAGPLAQFQATDASNREDVWAMVRSINEKCENRLPEGRLRTVFDKFWGELAEGLAAIQEGAQATDVPQRETSDILDELVKLAREQSTRIGVLEKAIENSGGNTSHSHYAIYEPREVRIGGDADEVTTLSASQRRLAASAARLVQQTIGPAYVASIQRKGAGIEVNCVEGAAERVREVNRELAELAEVSGLEIHVFGPEGLLEVFPPH